MTDTTSDAATQSANVRPEDHPVDPVALSEPEVAPLARLTQADDALPPPMRPDPEPVRPTATPAPAPRRSGSTLLGLVIGAILAVGAGYGAQRYLLPQTAFDPAPIEARLAAAEAEAQALRAEVTRLAEVATTPPPSVPPDQVLMDRIAALESATPADVAPLIARIDGLEANLAALANLPSETGVSPAALAALQAEVAALKSQDTGVPAELAAMADTVEARLTEAEARAADLTAQATAIAATATRNAALAQIGAALDSGLPYRAALTALGDEAVPEGLTAHADAGLPSVATLRAGFPDAARRALEAALRADPGDTWTDRMGTFLRNQTGARSLTPQEGSGPDAILSRAEAALARADVAAALTEIAALPSEAQQAMADWTARAQQRLDAQAALAGLLQTRGNSMIWSLLKVVLFVALIAAASFGANLLLESTGGIRMAVGGWELTLGPLQATVGALLLLAVLWLALKTVGLIVATLRFLNGDETAISRYFDRNRERRGYQALNDGLLALASGEGRLALIKAQRAAKYLERPELTTLLIAQAAEASGDGKRATDAYRALLANDATRFVGVRGLLNQKLAEGDTETALALAEKAFAMKPRHPETQDVLLRLQSEKADWKGARATLGAQQKRGALPRDVYRRRDAVLALQEAAGIMDERQSIEAREAAIAANRLSPDLIPAAAMAARSFIAKGEKRNAARVIRKAYEGQPHPDLAAVFAEIEPEETPAARLKRFKPLFALHPNRDETRLLEAELHISAEDFPAARRALGDVVTRHPTQRALAIMAAIERGEGSDEAVVRVWLTKALTAPRGPQWCCDKCHAIHATWGPICDNCGGFDTLSWREPPENTGPSATGTELLPLLVSAPKPNIPPESPVGPPGEVIDGTSVASRPD